jgi:hypothetical protein
MRVTLVFSGGISITPSTDMTNPNNVANKLIMEGGYTCDVLSLNGTLNVLNVGSLVNLVYIQISQTLGLEMPLHWCTRHQSHEWWSSVGATNMHWVSRSHAESL